MIRLALLALLIPLSVQAAELRVLTAGAYKAVLLRLAPAFEQRTGHTLAVQNETVGGVQRRVRAGEAFDMIVVTPAAAAALGELVRPGTVRPLARVGIAIAVPAGAPHPDIGTPDGVRAAVVAARAPSWIDPAAGGSSGIYMNKLWEEWGIAGLVVPKAVLVQGGLVADRLLDGRSDLAFQQQSELVDVPGVDLVGPLPEAIQNYTVYAGAIPAGSAQPDLAAGLLAYLAGPDAAPALAARGMSAP